MTNKLKKEITCACAAGLMFCCSCSVTVKKISSVSSCSAALETASASSSSITSAAASAVGTVVSSQNDTSSPQSSFNSSQPESSTVSAETDYASSMISDASLPESASSEAYSLNVNNILQAPELPMGCEITALTMVLNYMGYDVDKITMSDTYLPKSSNFYYVGDKKYGPDFRKVFAGDPKSDDGCTCDAPAIFDAANNYLTDEGSAQRAVNLTGSDPQTLYDTVKAGTPVVVWITICMADREISGGWYADGTDEYIEWASVDHCAVLTGYGEDYVEINDPISGMVSYPKAVFENIYKQRGMQAVIIQQ